MIFVVEDEMSSTVDKELVRADVLLVATPLDTTELVVEYTVAEDDTATVTEVVEALSEVLEITALEDADSVPAELLVKTPVALLLLL